MVPVCGRSTAVQDHYGIETRMVHEKHSLMFALFPWQLTGYRWCLPEAVVKEDFVSDANLPE